MKRLLPAVFVIAVLIVAIGFYRGWFVLSGSGAQSGRNKVDVNLSVDKDKIHDDVEAVKSKASEVTTSHDPATTP